jgi:predicted methyltransferase
MRIPPPFPARSSGLLLAACLLVAACTAAPAPEPAAPAAPASPSGAAPAAVPAVSPEVIVAASDRSEEDRQTDARRQPEKLLEFLGVRPGERVADLAAGSGYTTELLARAVGPAGVVYAQNDQHTLKNYVTESWPKRLARGAMRGVVRLDREFEAPLSPEARDLDLVTLLFSYHDVIARGADRSKLNAAVFQALRPGGLYVVADHQAPPGSGVAAASSLHRIEEKVVRQEIEAAGFSFVESGDFLKDPSDDATAPSFARKFQTDRFILKFRRPEAP